MRLEHIEIRSFRNLREISYEPDGLWVVFGPNGSGKSNLLEAISSLASRRQLGPRGTDHSQGFSRFVLDGSEEPQSADLFLLIELVFFRSGEIRSAIESAKARVPGEAVGFVFAEALWAEVASRVTEWATEDIDLEECAEQMPDLPERFVNLVLSALERRPRIVWSAARTWLEAYEADLSPDGVSVLHRLRKDLDERIEDISNQVDALEPKRSGELEQILNALETMAYRLDGPHIRLVDLPHGDHWRTGVAVVEYDSDPERVESDVDTELALLHNVLWDAKGRSLYDDLPGGSLVRPIPTEAAPFQRIDPWLHAGPDGTARIRGSVRAVYEQIERMANLLAPNFVRVQGRIIVRPRGVAEWPVSPARTWIGVETTTPLSTNTIPAISELALSLLGSGTRRWVGASVREACRRLRAAKTTPLFVADDERSPDWPSESREIFRAAEAAGTFDGYLDIEAESAPAVIIVDEPEAHLHPLVQTEIAEWLVDLSRQHAAVVVATHSPAFLAIAPEHAQLSALVPRGNESVLVSLDSHLLGSAQKLALSLGLHVQDVLLLARGFLLVEGKHDRTVLDHFFRNQFAQQRVVVVPISGTKNSPAVIESPILRALGRPVRAMFDHLLPGKKEDHAATSLKRAFAGSDFDVIPYTDPDIICALPEEAVRRAYPEVTFPGWDTVIDNWHRVRTPVNFKTYALKEMGLDPGKSTAFINRVLGVTSEGDEAGTSLRIAVNEALASMSVDKTNRTQGE